MNDHTLPQSLKDALVQRFPDHIEIDQEAKDMVTITLDRSNLLEIAEALRTESPFCFEQLMDVCGVDYSTYGLSEWRTREATASGFSRAQATDQPHRVYVWNKPRFAVVYHLLSVSLNQRLRMKVYLEEVDLSVPSVLSIWPACDWFEREAFDLFGIQFTGHPDLRRLLTDYGFKGHPFRKDFPLIGEVELRYDAALGRCVYEPVSIQPRVNVPKVIREDNRYLATPEET